MSSFQAAEVGRQSVLWRWPRAFGKVPCRCGRRIRGL